MTQTTQKLSRRTFFAGASTVGAIAVATSLMPTVRGLAQPTAQTPKPAPEKGGGYTLSDHVKQYYKTTLV